MSTQDTFVELVDRISVATEQLEVAVGIVGESTEVIEQAVIDAQNAATAAGISADISVASEQGAIASANAANASATTAQTQVGIAIQLVEDLEASAPFQEAPEDGNTYGRNNGAWVEVSGGGSGTVQSVNDVLPDLEGNITLAPSDIADNATPSVSGFMSNVDKTKLDTVATNATVGADWNTNVSNKPTIPTNTNQLTNGSGYITDAPNDGKQYARQSQAWSEVAASGFPFIHPAFENGWEYNFGTAPAPDWREVTSWPTDPLHAVSLSSFRRRGSPHAGASSGLPTTGATGEAPIVWNQMFSTGGYIQYIPPGIYWFTTTSFTNNPGGANLFNKTGYITVYGSAGGVGLKRARAETYDATTGIASVWYWKNDGTWNKAVV